MIESNDGFKLYHVLVVHRLARVGAESLEFFYNAILYARGRLLVTSCWSEICPELAPLILFFFASFSFVFLPQPFSFFFHEIT